MCVWGRTMNPMRGEKNEPNQNSPRNKDGEDGEKEQKRVEDWKGKDLTFTPVQRQNFLLRGAERLIT